MEEYSYQKRKHERGYEDFKLYLQELLDDPTITLPKFCSKHQYSESKIQKLSAKNDWIKRGKNYLETMRSKRLKQMEGIYNDLNWSQLQLAVNTTKLEKDLIQDQQEHFDNKTLKSSTISNTLKKTEESAMITMTRYYAITGHKLIPDNEPETEEELEENQVDKELLNEENMEDRLNLLHKIVSGDRQ